MVAESSSSEESLGGGPARARNLRDRARARARAYVDARLGGAPGLTFLEERAVSKRVSQAYVTHLRAFLDWADRTGVPLGEDGEIDIGIVRYFNEKFFEGCMPHVGEKTAAVLLHSLPQYSKTGACALPRCWGALQGWRKLCPRRSRTPLPWGFWAALCCHLSNRGHLLKAVYVLLLVEAYMRPGEGLGLLREDLLPPAAGVSAAWTLLICPSGRPEVTKGGEQDDSVRLDSKRLRWLDPVLLELSAGPRREKVFPFTYPELLRDFKLSAAAVGQPTAVPYQARHSGPSIDLASGARDLLSAKKRGRWKTDKSLVNYEKHGRLQLAMAKLTPGLRAHYELAAGRLEGVILGRVPWDPPSPLASSIEGGAM